MAPRRGTVHIAPDKKARDLKGDGELTAPSGVLSLADAALFALAAPRGAVRAIGGIDAATIAEALDAAEPEGSSRRAVIVKLQPVPTASSVIEQVLVALADVARKLWPLWWGGVRFPEGRDSLTRAAAGDFGAPGGEGDSRRLGGLGGSGGATRGGWAPAARRRRGTGLRDCPASAGHRARRFDADRRCGSERPLASRTSAGSRPRVDGRAHRGRGCRAVR